MTINIKLVQNARWRKAHRQHDTHCAYEIQNSFASRKPQSCSCGQAAIDINEPHTGIGEGTPLRSFSPGGGLPPPPPGRGRLARPPLPRRRPGPSTRLCAQEELRQGGHLPPQLPTGSLRGQWNRMNAMGIPVCCPHLSITTCPYEAGSRQQLTDICKPESLSKTRASRRQQSHIRHSIT